MKVGEIMIPNKNFKKTYLDEIKTLEEALLNYMGKKDLNILRTEYPDSKWEKLTEKLAKPNEYFNSLDDYQKPVDNLRKEDFFSKLKNKCPDNEEIEQTREIF